jgi:competence ComEA-like helix-hairpin-helix protein
MIARIGLALIIICFGVADVFARGPWVVLQNCHYLTKRNNDGDSFHVSVEGKEYIFRLYFVDAPETDTEFRDRVEEQAKYFGITVEQNRQLGLLAKAYTRETLGGQFVIQTCWEDAMGRSRMQRFYGLVETPTGDLGEQLVENGLARIHGFQANPEGLTAARQEWQKLVTLERKAKRERIGGWGANEDRMAVRTQVSESAKSVFTALFHPQAVGQNATSASSTGNKLDINTASQAELENLPGVGPVMAERIIEARPFKSADDLRNVKGIGDKKYEKLRPYFN